MKRSAVLSELKGALRASGVKKAYIFGSFARKEKAYNDIDVAIVPPAGFSLLDMVGLEQAISKKVQKRVDLMTLRSISPYLMPYIKKDLVAI